MKRYMDKLIYQLTADKKKLGIMLCVLSLGLLLWGRLLLQGVPRTATADDKSKTVQADDSPADNASRTEISTRARPIVYVDLPDSPHRDLFGIDPRRYKQTKSGIESHIGPKSALVTSDVDPRIAVVREEAMELRLESVVTGTHPRAYINGRLLAPGEEYEGFTLLQVTDRHVILTKYGLFIKLKM
jgi:hypothetical protein